MFRRLCLSLHRRNYHLAVHRMPPRHVSGYFCAQTERKHTDCTEWVNGNAPRFLLNETSTTRRAVCCFLYMGRLKTKEEFVADAREVWGDRYDYSESDYENLIKPITIRCPKHEHTFRIPMAQSHLIKPSDKQKPTGCPICSYERKNGVSFGPEWREYLQLSPKGNTVGKIKRRKTDNPKMSRKDIVFRENGYWTREHSFEAAAFTGSRSEFRRKFSGAVYAAINGGYYEELTQGMVRRGLWDKERKKVEKSGIVYPIKTTNEEALATALQYHSFPELIANSPRTYQILLKRGLLEEMWKHYERKHVPEGSRTKESVMEEARQCSRMEDFKHKHSGSYQYAFKMGWIEEIREMYGYERIQWSISKAEEIIAQCKTRKEFRKNYTSCYNYLLEHGLLEEMTANLERVGDLYKRKIYVFEFKSGHAYVGLSADPEKRHAVHLVDETSSVYQHIESTGYTDYEFKLLTDWLDKDAAAKAEEEYRQKYESDGWKILNKVKCGSLGGWHKPKYTIDDAIAMIEDGQSPSEFMKEHRTIYEYCRRHSWLSILFSDYVNPRAAKKLSNDKKAPAKKDLQPLITIEAAKELANGYDSRMEFARTHPQIYRFCGKNGWLQEVFGDMPMQRGRRKQKVWSEDWERNEIGQYETLPQIKRENRRLFSRIRNGKLVDKYFVKSFGIYVVRKEYLSEENRRRQIEEFGALEYRPKHSLRECKDIASGYPSRAALKNDNKTMYDFIRKHYNMDEVFSAHPKRSNVIWDDEKKVQKEIGKYDTLAQIYKDSPSLYSRIQYKKLHEKYFHKQLYNGQVVWVVKPEYRNLTAR